MGFDRSQDENQQLNNLEKGFLEFYFLKSKELGKLKKSLTKIQEKLKPDLSEIEQDQQLLKIKIISEQIDRIEDEIEELVPSEIKFAAHLRHPKIQNRIEAHIKETYLDPLQKILFNYYGFLGDKLLTKFIKLKIISQEEADNLKQNLNPNDIKELTSKSEEYSLDAKEKKWIDRHLDQFSAIFEIIDIVDDEDLFPSNALNEVQILFNEKKKIISDIGEEGYSITKLWAKKVRVVDEIQQLLDNYRYNLYIPPKFSPSRNSIPFQ